MKVKIEIFVMLQLFFSKYGYCDTVQLKCDGTRWRKGGELKGKLANGVGSQYPSHYLGTLCIQHYYRWCAHHGWPVVDWTDANRRFKWTRPFSPERRNLICARVPSHFDWPLQNVHSSSFAFTDLHGPFTVDMCPLRFYILWYFY